MRKVILIFLIAGLLAGLPGYKALAHVCDDVLAHDPIIIWPEEEQVEISRIGEFKIFLRNEYYGSINQVRLILPKSPFEISVTPSVIERVASKEEVFFVVSLTIPKETKPGSYPLSIKVNAREFEVDRMVDLTVRVKPRPEPEARVEIVPRDIPLALSPARELIEAEPGQLLKFKVFVRNAHTAPLRELKLRVQKEPFEVIGVNPSLLEEVGPGDTTFFEITLRVPEEIKPGDYLLLAELKAQEPALERGTSLLIRVKEVREWLPYLYLLAILLLLVLLAWRWRKRTRPKPF